MSKIDDKWGHLKTQGVDFGHPLGPEEDAAAGGRVRRYQYGTIFWDTVTSGMAVGIALKRTVSLVGSAVESAIQVMLPRQRARVGNFGKGTNVQD